MVRPRIVFASYALPGHINKCIVLATELAQRGYPVLFATQDAGRAWLSHPGIEFLSWEPWAAGDFVARLREVRGEISEKSNERHRLALSDGAAADVYAAAFSSLKAALEPVVRDLLVVPQVLIPGIDLAHDRRWPLLIQASYLPRAVRLGEGAAAVDAGARSPWRRRVASLRWMAPHVWARRRLRRARAACARAIALDDLFRSVPIVAMTDAVIEGTSVTRNVRLVGPLIPRPLPILPGATRRWLDDHVSRGVVVVAFGTLVKLPDALVTSLAEALASCDVAALWALPEHRHQLIRKHSPAFRAETFVHQTTVLSHPSVRAFVSHAGVNSAIEAMYWGRPILALPFMFDQHHYAARVVDLGVGVRLDPRVVTRGAIRDALQRLLCEPAFTDAARGLAARLQQTPGVEGAADAVEGELARRHA